MDRDRKPPLAEELIDRARAMIPELRSRAAGDEAARKINDDTIARMVDAGFFRVLQAKRWGGYEIRGFRFTGRLC